jgi:hypothetical protein
MKGEYKSARSALDRAVNLLPSFAQMERTWLLAGKLDYFEGLRTPQEQFFRAHQLSYDRMRPLAKAIMRDQDAAAGGKEIAVNRQLSKVLVETALAEFRQMNSLVQDEDAWRRGIPYFAVPGFYPPRLMAAQAAWEEASGLAAFKRSNAFFYLGQTAAHNDRYRPQEADSRFAPMLDRLADRVLRADIHATQGNAYFESGDFITARKYYQSSVVDFMLPKIINYRGQKGLGGL